jgi:hypothetical protein
MTDTMPHQAPTAEQAARARECPLCGAVPGMPCQRKPAGDHLARYLDAYTAGQLTRAYLAAVLGELVGLHHRHDRPRRRVMSGPYDTQRQAADAARHIIDSPPGTGAWTDGCHRLLEDACRAAGVQLGAYDHQVVLWLAGWEPWTVAVVAGLITRAHAGVPGDDARRTILDALDVAADHKRDMAANCGDCEARPKGLCPTCEWRMDAADAYDHVAAKLRGGRP